MGHYLSEMPDGYRDMIARVGGEKASDHQSGLEAAARELHAQSGHTHPSGKLTRWEELTPFQVEQFRIGARRILDAAASA